DDDAITRIELDRAAVDDATRAEDEGDSGPAGVLDRRIPDCKPRRAAHRDAVSPPGDREPFKGRAAGSHSHRIDVRIGPRDAAAEAGFPPNGDVAPIDEHGLIARSEEHTSELQSLR